MAIALVLASMASYTIVFTTPLPIQPIAGLTLGVLLCITQPHWWKVVLGAAVASVLFGLAQGSTTPGLIANTAASLLEATVIALFLARETTHRNAGHPPRLAAIALCVVIVTLVATAIRTTAIPSGASVWPYTWLSHLIGMGVFALWIHTLGQPRAEPEDNVSVTAIAPFWIAWALLHSLAFTTPAPASLAQLAAIGAMALLAPMTICARLRFSMRTSTTAVALSAITMSGATLAGRGPFAMAPEQLSAFLLQAYLAVLVMAELVLQRSHDHPLAELEQSTEELKSANARYRALIHQYPDSIFRVALDSPIKVTQSMEEQIQHFRQHAYVAECNDTFARQIGFTRASDILGKPVSIVTQDSHEQKFLQSLHDTIQSGYRMTGYESTRTNDKGEPRTYLNSWFGVFDQNGMSDVWCLQMDITEKNKLRDADYMLRQALENAGSGGYEVESETGYTTYSERALRSFGFTPDQVRPHSDFMFERIHPDDLERHWEVIRANLRGDTEFYDDDIRFLHGDNTYHWVNIRGSVVKRDSDGRAKSVVAITTDVTEAHKNRELLDGYRNRLQELVAELALTEEKSRKTLATALQEGALQDLSAARSKLSSLGSSVGSQLPGIQRLLESAISQARTVMFEISPSVLYERGLLDAVQWLCDSHAEHTGLHCELSQSGHAKPLTDESTITLYQIARELLINVTRHAHASRAWVHFEWSEDELRLTVSDNGTGFSTEQTDKGFGLFSIRNRLELLGGTLSISKSTRSESGSMVEVRVPILAQADTASNA